MKKRITILLIVISLFFCGLVKSAIVFADEADEPDNTDYIHQAITVSPHSKTIKRGQAYKLSATLDPVASNGTITWSSSNTSVATVTSYGLVIGKSAGTVTITATVDCPMVQGWTYVDHCTITVSSSRIITDGTYLIQTAQRNNNGELIEEFVAIEGNSTSSGTKLMIAPLSDGKVRQWIFTLGSDGYYRIKSKLSSKYIWVNNNSSSSGVAIKQYSSVASGSKWAVMETTAGNYAFVPASATSSLIVMNVPGNSTGTNLNTATYTSDTFYKDEWKLQPMLPLSGYELQYSPSAWSGCVEDCCNCYSYAINNQVYPGHNWLWYFQRMGWYAGEDYLFEQYTSDAISTAVTYDYSQYNYDFNTSYIFQPISRTAVCPAGTYKVALVIGASSSDYDYHWYRQDADGFWSHKLAWLPVTRYDSEGKLIIDPKYAARDYTNLEPAGYNYSTFVGYFAVTPWNNYLSPSNPVWCYIVIETDDGYEPDLKTYDQIVPHLSRRTKLSNSDFAIRFTDDTEE